jgi:hypothetical protein
MTNTPKPPGAALLIFACLALAAALPATAAETGQVIASTELKGEPFADAKTIATLPPASPVEIIKRQGGWLRVKPAGGEAGWLKLTGVKLGGGEAKGGDSGVGSLVNVARSGRSGNTGVTVATGVRGLTPEDLKNAQPAPEAVKKLDDYAVPRKDAEAFASKASLQRQNVEYLAGDKVAENAIATPVIVGERK